MRGLASPPQTEVSQEFPLPWGIGARLTDAIVSPSGWLLRPDVSSCALSEGNPWSHEYECSSPDQFRKFHMIVYPLKDGRGGLVVNSLVIEKPHDPKHRPAHAAELGCYTDEHGSLHQCMHCRRARRNTALDQWDWVPAWVAQSPPNTSHGLCQTVSRLPLPGAGGRGGGDCVKLEAATGISTDGDAERSPD